MKTLINTFLALLALCTISSLTSCNKDKGTARMTIKMTDEPGDYDSVIVEVLNVEVNYIDKKGNDNWEVLNTKSGVYDLLLLQNGLTTVLSDNESVPVGELGQMRLILGTNNYVIVEEEKFPLELSSQDKTGLKFNLNTEVEKNDKVEIVFDFDADKSIVITGNGQYKLKPVLKVESILFL